MTGKELMSCIINFNLDANVKVELQDGQTYFVDGVFTDEDKHTILLKTNYKEQVKKDNVVQVEKEDVEQIEVEPIKDVLEIKVHKLTDKDMVWFTDILFLLQYCATTKEKESMESGISLIATICINAMCIWPNYAYECGHVVEAFNDCIHYNNIIVTEANQNEYYIELKHKLDILGDRLNDLYKVMIANYKDDKSKYAMLAETDFSDMAQMTVYAMLEKVIPYHLNIEC